MSVNDNDLYEIIRNIIYEETKMLKHYVCKVVVNTDPLKKGRVKVLIPELNIDTPDVAIWCYPRQSRGLSIPKVSEYVEVWFINGEIERAVYMTTCFELTTQLIKNITTTTKHVLFESPKSIVDVIEYDEGQGLFTICKGTEKAILGDKLKTYLTDFVNTTFNTHVHSGVLAGGANTGVPTVLGTPPTDVILSTKVKLL